MLDLELKIITNIFHEINTIFPLLLFMIFSEYFFDAIFIIQKTFPNIISKSRRGNFIYKKKIVIFKV